MQNCAELGSVLSLSHSTTKVYKEKMTYIMGIAICESGIRTCPVNFETVNFVDSGSAALANASC